MLKKLLLAEIGFILVIELVGATSSAASVFLLHRVDPKFGTAWDNFSFGMQLLQVVVAGSAIGFTVPLVLARRFLPRLSATRVLALGAVGGVLVQLIHLTDVPASVDRLFGISGIASVAFLTVLPGSVAAIACLLAAMARWRPIDGVA